LTHIAVYVDQHVLIRIAEKNFAIHDVELVAEVLVKKHGAIKTIEIIDKIIERCGRSRDKDTADIGRMWTSVRLAIVCCQVGSTSGAPPPQDQGSSFAGRFTEP
jgi:hypothetical protein